MTIITNTTLLIRRIAEVRRRREAVVDRQERLRGSLPQWALAPLQLVGMTASEIQGLMTELSAAEKQSGLEDVERELDQLDQQIEELENLLLTTPSHTLDGIQAVLDMAVTARSSAPGSPRPSSRRAGAGPGPTAADCRAGAPAGRPRPRGDGALRRSAGSAGSCW